MNVPRLKKICTHILRKSGSARSLKPRKPKRKSGSGWTQKLFLMPALHCNSHHLMCTPPIHSLSLLRRRCLNEVYRKCGALACKMCGAMCAVMQCSLCIFVVRRRQGWTTSVCAIESRASQIRPFYSNKHSSSPQATMIVNPI